MKLAMEQNRQKCQNSGISCRATKCRNKGPQGLHTCGVIGFKVGTSEFKGDKLKLCLWINRKFYCKHHSC